MQNNQSGSNLLSEFASGWQNITNIMAKIIGVPAGLVMCVRDESIEVFVSSETENNPYHVGDSENLEGSGLYCETVIKTNEKLLVPNALKDDDWKNNPDVKLNMISYLGFPIRYPDGKSFGTICVLDSVENHYSELYVDLLRNFRDLIESQLSLCYMNQNLGGESAQIVDYVNELKALRHIAPICSYCKRIKDEKDEWQSVEDFLISEHDMAFTHTYCPECMKKNYPDI